MPTSAVVENLVGLAVWVAVLAVPAVVWRADGVRQDTWFEGWQARPGVYVVVRGGTGWGPHNRNPHVFFVAPHGVIGWVPGAAPRAWARQPPNLRPARNLHDFSAHRGAHAG